MSVNGITSTQDATNYSYSVDNTAKQKETTVASNIAKADDTTTTAKSDDTGVIYEKGEKQAATSSVKKTYTPDTNLINKLKADADARTSQLKSIVEQMMTKQATAYGNANDIWSFLREGNFTVDPATKAQAEEDISEDGYWGVKQTSERILQFANALTGGDPDKIESMREAFKKGYEQAEKMWGGELPDISKQTYEAVLKGFDKQAEEAGIVTQQ